jgi:phenylpyruvate tautomerase PptA (4-oxalocrotonate tautomerase family)
MMPFANIKIPQAAHSRAQKKDLIHRTTAMFVDFFGEGVRPTTMVLVERSPMAAMAGPTRCSSYRKPIASRRRGRPWSAGLI